MEKQLSENAILTVAESVDTKKKLEKAREEAREKAKGRAKAAERAAQKVAKQPADRNGTRTPVKKARKHIKNRGITARTAREKRDETMEKWLKNYQMLDEKPTCRMCNGRLAPRHATIKCGCRIRVNVPGTRGDCRSDPRYNQRRRLSRLRESEDRRHV